MTQECCPEFDAKQWNEKTITWRDQKFAKDKVLCFFYMPLNFGTAMKRLMTKLEAAHAQSPNWICLSDHMSKWRMDVYLAVDRDLPDTQMQTMTGTFISKVYDGPFSETKKWCEDFADYAKREGVETGKTYMWYTTCPKCAKKRGKNYVAILAEVKPSASASASA